MKTTAKGSTAFPFLFTTILAGIISLTVLSAPSYGATSWDVGVSGGEDGIDGFHLSVGEHYRVPQRDVVVIRDRGIHDEALPVVFYLAKRARVSPGVIVDLHLRGLSWMDITLHYGLSPEIYYVPVRIIEGRPPHGHAYGYYKKHPNRDGWKNISLSDDDIVDQVNLKFISDHYGYSPDKVMKYRSEGKRFSVIDRDIKQEKKKNGGKKNVKKDGDKNKNGSFKKGSGKDKGGKDNKWKNDKAEGKGKK